MSNTVYIIFTDLLFVFAIVLIAFLLFKVGVVDYFTEVKKASIKKIETRLTNKFPYYLFDSSNLNAILFWLLLFVLSRLSLFVLLPLKVDGFVITRTIYLISWSIAALLMVSNNNPKFSILDIVSVIFVVAGCIFQLTFDASSLGVNSSESFFDPKDKIHVVLLSLYYFLNINLFLIFFGRFTIIKHKWNTQSIPRALNSSSINYKGVEKIMAIISSSISLIVALLFMGMDYKNLSILTGFVTLGVTYALRDLITNFIAGLVLMWDESIKTNNVISIQNYLVDYDEEPYGWIEEVNMRYTVIQDRNNINLIIPNSVLINNPIINWTQHDNAVRIRLDVSIDYKADLEKAIKVIPEACKGEDRVLTASKYQPKVNVMRFNDSGIDLQLRFYINDPKNGIRNIKSRIFRNVFKILNDQKITIPFPQRDVHLDISKSTKTT